MSQLPLEIWLNVFDTIATESDFPAHFQAYVGLVCKTWFVRLGAYYYTTLEVCQPILNHHHVRYIKNEQTESHRLNLYYFQHVKHITISGYIWCGSLTLMGSWLLQIAEFPRATLLTTCHEFLQSAITKCIPRVEHVVVDLPFNVPVATIAQSCARLPQLTRVSFNMHENCIPQQVEEYPNFPLKRVLVHNSREHGIHWEHAVTELCFKVPTISELVIVEYTTPSVPSWVVNRIKTVLNRLVKLVIIVSPWYFITTQFKSLPGLLCGAHSLKELCITADLPRGSLDHALSFMRLDRDELTKYDWNLPALETLRVLLSNTPTRLPSSVQFDQKMKQKLPRLKRTITTCDGCLKRVCYGSCGTWLVKQWLCE